MDELGLRLSAVFEAMSSENHQRAAELLEELLAEMEAEGPREDLGALQVRRYLIIAYERLGRHAEAEELAAPNLTGYRRLLGPEDPDTLRAQVDLALAYAGTGRHDEAVALLSETAGAWRVLMGADYCDTLACQYTLARVLWETGRRDQSAALQEQTLAACQRALGPDDGLTRQVAEMVAAMRDDPG